jgi:hypothetical protein
MPVPLSVDHRIRMLIWGWAVQGYGVEDIEVMLRKDGASAPREFIWEIVVQARQRNKAR